MFSMFIWWAAVAVIKYWDQPLVTDIIPSFGDNKNGIQFPLITFCSMNIRSHLKKACKMIDDGSPMEHFNDKIIDCLRNDKTFTLRLND